jgi:hypothetical protein
VRRSARGAGEDDITDSEGNRMAGKHTIIPHLWFDRNAEDAVNFYISIFDPPHSRPYCRWSFGDPAYWDRA